MFFSQKTLACFQRPWECIKPRWYIPFLRQSNGRGKDASWPWPESPTAI